jgi:putative peptidoglycan lipid II flippase
MSTAPGRISFFRAFMSSALGTGLSRIMGAARDIVVASLLGAGDASDAFQTAFIIPNTFRRFVADEGLTGALIPALAKAQTEAGPDAVRRLGANTLGALLVANLLLLIVGWFGAEYIVMAFAYSWRDDPSKPFALTVQMTRYLFPFLTMVSLVSYFEGLLNFKGHFFTPKIAPAVVSAGIVASGLLLHTSFEQPVFSLVVGVLVGGVAHVLVNLPPLWASWGAPAVGFAFHEPRLRGVLWELSKVIAIGVFAQLNILVLRQLAATLPSGSITHYFNATRVGDLAQGVVAVAIGSALLPNLSASVSSKDWETVSNDLVGAMRLAGFLLLPVGATLSVFAEPVTALLFRRGAYTAADVVTTAAAVQWLVPFMLSVAALNILKKVFFALEDRQTLLAVGAAGVALTAAIGAYQVDAYGVVGLSMALSAATCAQLLAYIVVLRRRLGKHLGLSRLVRPYAEIGVCLLPVVLILVPAASYGDWSQGSSFENLVLAGIALALAAFAYLGSAQLVGLSEVRRVTSRLLARFLPGAR